MYNISVYKNDRNKKWCFVHLFSPFLLGILIIEQTFGFDRHGYFPLFANSFIIIPNHLMNVENKILVFSG